MTMSQKLQSLKQLSIEEKQAFSQSKLSPHLLEQSDAALTHRDEQNVMKPERLGAALANGRKEDEAVNPGIFIV